MAKPADAAGRPLRIVIDANIWVAYAISLQLGRTETLSQEIVGIARTMKFGTRLAQIVISLEMVDTVARVLSRRGFPLDAIEDFTAAIIDLMKSGPERLNPVLLVAGRDQIAISDREDAGVLAAAVAAKAHLLVTDNLADFATNDGEIVETRKVRSAKGERQLFVILHERPDAPPLVVAHPADVLEWMRRDLLPDASAFRAASQTGAD
ncbi:PIN domain-containing protein [Rhizobiaceae sp. 2RAB30]